MRLLFLRFAALVALVLDTIAPAEVHVPCSNVRCYVLAELWEKGRTGKIDAKMQCASYADWTAWTSSCGPKR
jgi:hypothetical protein